MRDKFSRSQFQQKFLDVVGSVAAALLTLSFFANFAIPTTYAQSKYDRPITSYIVCEGILGGRSAPSAAAPQSQFPLLTRIQSQKENVLPENIGALSAELKKYLSAHRGKRILIFTDATSLELAKTGGPRARSNFGRPVRPQTSGVVTVMQVMQDEILAEFGIEVRFVTPEEFKIHHQIGYQDVVLAAPTKKELDRIIAEKEVLAVHIMVEGVVGKAAKKYLTSKGIPFSTAYHTDFPQYVLGAVKYYATKFLGTSRAEKIMKWLETPERRKFLAGLVMNDLRGFHVGSSGVMVPTQAMLAELEKNGFPTEDLRLWSHGVDLEKFGFNSNPNVAWYEAKAKEMGLIPADAKLKWPILLYVGRIGEEKSVDFFLDLPVNGTKVVVGNGPLLEEFKAKYPNALFFGRQPHSAIPEFMANADVFPFPSRTETFGLVNLEAAATGTPVVTFDYLREIISRPEVGSTVPYTGNREEDLRAFGQATRLALSLPREGVRAYAEGWSWHKSIVEMLAYLTYLSPEQSAKLRAQR